MTVPAVRAFGDALDIASRNLTEDEAELVHEFLTGDEVTDADIIAAQRPAVLYRMKTELVDRFWDLTPGRWTERAVTLSREELPGEQDYNQHYLTAYWEGSTSLKWYVNADWYKGETDRFTHRELDVQFVEAAASGNFVNYDEIRFRFVGVAPKNFLHVDHYLFSDRINGVADSLVATPNDLLEAKMMVEAEHSLSSTEQMSLIYRLFRHPNYPLEFLRTDEMVRQALWVAERTDYHPLSTTLFLRGLAGEEVIPDVGSEELHLLCHSTPKFDKNYIWSKDPKFLLARPDLDRQMLDEVLEFRKNSRGPSNIDVWSVILRRPLLPTVDLLRYLVTVEKMEEWEFELLLHRLDVEGGLEEFVGDKIDLLDLPMKMFQDILAAEIQVVSA